MLGLGTFLFAFFLSYGGTVALLRWRPRGTFLDVPNERSSHEAPKPRFGGIAIVLAFVLAFVLLLVKQPGTGEHWPLLAGGLLIFATGVVDDWRSLPVSWRFGAQVLAAAVVVGTGHVVHDIYVPLVGTLDLGVAGLPLTVLFILTSINFYNFIDGIDGLAAGSGFIATVFLALIAFMLGHVAFALLCLAVSGAAVGFLQFNFPPSRLFMGDSGSTFLGFFFAYVAVVGNSLQPSIPFFIPVLILSSLYLDAGLTLVKRALKGEKVFQPHKIHYYQRLLSLGLNHKQVTVLEYGLTVLLGTSAVIFFKAGGFFPVFLMGCWVAVFAALILKVRSLERGDRAFWERRSLLVVTGDLVMIAVAYFGAYFLRMNFRFTEAEGMAVLRAFPIVLVVRSACFYWYGLYRGVWKYTSTPDVLRIIKAVTTGSAIILALVVLFYRFVAFPRSLFVIEWGLLILALGGTRFASRLFHEYGKEALGANISRVAIIGAGDMGEHVAREIRNRDGKTMSVACFIDDDKDKTGLVLQGVPIVGAVDDLGDICRRFDIDRVVLAVRNLPDARLAAVVAKAREAGVPLETRDATVGPRRTIIELDRIGRVLERRLPFEPAASTEAFFARRRVLITNGGQDLGPGLAQALLAAGATVTVHVDSAREAAGFDDRCAVFASGIEREIDAARVLDAARPSVVFHCNRLDARHVVNETDYLWRRIMRTTEALCGVLPKHSLESLIFVNFWDGAACDGLSAHMTAASEILALNSPALLPMAPKMLRIPRVLGRGRIRELIQGDAVVDGASFGLLEYEATTLCLDAVFAYKGRVILVPRTGAPISERDVARVLRGEAPPALSHEARRRDLMFDGEEEKPSILAGAREVVSPFYPAGDDVLAVVRDCVQHPPSNAPGNPWGRFAEVLQGHPLRSPTR